jgi:hypothetical protein
MINIVMLYFAYKINFNDCMKIVKDDILDKIIYGSSDDDNLTEIMRLIQMIRISTYKFEPDRHYPRIAIRTAFPWYAKGYMHGNHTNY